MALTKIDDRGLKTPIPLLDNEKIRFGTGDDLQIYHDGTKNVWLAAQGFDTHIYANGTPEEGIRVRATKAVELYYDNSKKFETASGGINVSGFVNVQSGNHIYLADNGKLLVGASNDLQIYHDGTNSKISDVGTGDLQLLGANVGIYSTGGEPMFVGIANGATELYYDNVKYFETRSDGTQTLGDHYFVGTNNYVQWDKSEDMLRFMDGEKATFGNGDDFRIYHDGSVNTLISLNGAVYIKGDASNVVGIQPRNGENAALFFPDGAVQLYYDNVKKFETHTNGVQVTGDIHLSDQAYMRYGTSDSAWIQGEDGGSGYLKFGVNNVQMTVNRDGTINIPDNNKFTCGASNDLQIYHSGGASLIDHTGTGILFIRGNGQNSLRIRAKPDENGMILNPNGSVELMFDGAQKLETTSGGITVNGSVTTQDINLSNLNAPTPNEVDSTRGSWTMQEGADDLFLINRSNGKKYKFNLTEVS